MFEETTSVLVIEDNPGDADLITALFEEAGGGKIRVETADRLSVGLRRLSLGSVDLVLLDLSLPDSHGLATLHAVTREAPDIPVVVMTGLDDETAGLDAVKQGAQDYLIKGRVGGALLARTTRYAIERFRVQRDLRESYRLTQQIVDILYIYDVSRHRIVYGSPRFCSLLGTDSTKIAASRPSLPEDLVHPEDREVWARQVQQLARAKDDEAVEGQFRIKVAGGDWRWLHAREAVFTRSPNRSPELILGTAQDISNQKRLEAEVEDLREKLAQKTAALPEGTGDNDDIDSSDHSPDMQALVDLVSGEVVECNQAFADAVGQQKQDLTGRSSKDPRAPDGSDLVRAAIASVSEPGGEFEKAGTFARADGTTVNVVQTAVPVRDESGKIVATQATWREVARGLDAADAGQAATVVPAADLVDFARVASHDLKEPLRGILNYANFLIEDYAQALDEQAHSRLKTIVRLAKRQESLVDALLHYSHLDTTEPVCRRTDLQRVVDQVIGSLAPNAERAGVEIRVPQPLPAADCDGALVMEIFHHLISNAIKFNDKSEKWVEIGFGNEPAKNRERQGASASQVFYVRDNGIGVGDKHSASVFRFFKRLHGRDEFGGGTGAGLALVRKLVEKHGGRVWMDSSLGEGSTFYFTLGRTGG